MSFTIHLFTSSFPEIQSRDRNFIEPELGPLLEKFEEVVLYPYRFSGRTLSLPDRVRCDASFSKLRLRRFGHPLAWVEALFHPATRPVLGSALRQGIQPRLWGRMVMGGLVVHAVRRWLQERIRRGEVNPEQSLFYTHMMSPVTVGLRLGLADRARSLLVTRCIGGDVYVDQMPHGFPGFRGAGLASVDAAFLCSGPMLNYLMQCHPEHETKYRVRRLGVPERGIRVEPSSDGVFRVVSSGRMDAVKRYGLLAGALVELARGHPSRRVEWQHVGEGELLEGIEGMLAREAPDNLAWIIHVDSPDSHVAYRAGPVDVFVHVSRSEGLPVVVMEALNCGVPVVAADAGGMADLVDETVGRLLPKDLDAGQLADTLSKVMDEPIVWAAKRPVAVKRWQERADSDTNHQAFVSELSQLAVEPFKELD